MFSAAHQQCANQTNENDQPKGNAQFIPLRNGFGGFRAPCLTWLTRLHSQPFV